MFGYFFVGTRLLRHNSCTALNGATLLGDIFEGWGGSCRCRTVLVHFKTQLLCAPNGSLQRKTIEWCGSKHPSMRPQLILFKCFHLFFLTCPVQLLSKQTGAEGLLRFYCYNSNSFFMWAGFNVRFGEMRQHFPYCWGQSCSLLGLFFKLDNFISQPQKHCLVEPLSQLPLQEDLGSLWLKNKGANLYESTCRSENVNAHFFSTGDGLLWTLMQQ